MVLFDLLAVPVEEEDGLTVLPLMVYVVVTDVPIPPDQPSNSELLKKKKKKRKKKKTVNPVVEIDEGVILVIGVGNASTYCGGRGLPVIPLPADVFVGVITNAHDVPVNEVNVAAPVDEDDGMAVVPLMVYVLVTDVPIPSDQVTVNPSV